MRTGTLTSTALGFALFTLAGAAAAYPTYEAAVPNGAASVCFACHQNGGGSTAVKTAFATAFQASNHKWTAALANADADGDMQTNGQELGDPCGTWKPGAAPGRADGVSNPADPASTSTSPTTPACGGGAATSGGDSGASSAAVTTGSAAGSTSGGGGSVPYSVGPGPGTPKPAVPTGACASIAPVGTGGALGALWLAFGAMALRRRVQRKR